MRVIKSVYNFESTFCGDVVVGISKCSCQALNLRILYWVCSKIETNREEQLPNPLKR